MISLARVNALTAWTKRAIVQLCRDRFLVILVGAILFVRIVYLFSYPFLIEGDGETYYQLLLESQAHLLHATGYIFFSLPLTLLAKLAGTEPANLLLYFQQAVSMASVTALSSALRRLVPRWIGFLTCLPLGIDAQMVAAAGTTRPEFLQANILLLLISSAIFGLTSERGHRKTIFYMGTGVFTVAGYLTKYNFLPSLVFCLLPLFDNGLRWKSRWWMLAKSGLGGALLLLLFLTTFHYPTTGSLRLNLVHGWIHLFKLKHAGIPILPANGLATQKYIVLSESLPQFSAGPGPWKKINEVPEAVRAPFRQRWSAFLATDDAQEVRASFDSLGPPEQRRANYHEAAACAPIYYYLGLEEGEKLLRAVFWEGVRGYSGRYLSSVWTALVLSADFSAHYQPYLPVPGVYEPPGFVKSSRTPILAARTRVFKAVDWSVAQPKDLAALADQIWYPGASLFPFLAFIKYIPVSCLWIVMSAGLVAAVVSIFRRRGLRAKETLLFLTAAALFGQMTFCALVQFFRMKELILCQPLIYLVTGLSISLWVEFASRARQHN